MPEETKLPDKITLPQLLELMRKMDDGLIELSVEDMETLGRKAKIKVDHYKYFMDKCDAEAARLEKMIKDFTARKKSIENKKKGAEFILMTRTKAEDLDGMAGDEYSFKIKVLKQNKCILNKGFEKPDQAAFLEHSDFIGCKYSWKLDPLKKELKAGNTDLQKIAKLIDTESLAWQPTSNIE